MRAMCLGLLCLLLCARAAAAQTALSSFEPEARLLLQRPASDLIRPGLLGGAAGVVLGSVLIGIPLAHALEPTDDGLSTPGILIGWQLGQAVGIPLGVHLGNARQDRLSYGLMLSAAVAIAGTTLLWTDNFDELFDSRRSQIILVAVPLTQLITSIYASRQ